MVQIKLFHRRADLDGVAKIEGDVNGWLGANPKIVPQKIRLTSGQDAGVPQLYALVVYEPQQ